MGLGVKLTPMDHQLIKKIKLITSLLLKVSGAENQ